MILHRSGWGQAAASANPWRGRDLDAAESVIAEQPDPGITITYGQDEILAGTFDLGLYGIAATDVDIGFASRVSREAEAEIPTDGFVVYGNSPIHLRTGPCLHSPHRPRPVLNAPPSYVENDRSIDAVLSFAARVYASRGE